MGNISILAGLKNNLAYSQFFYETTRALYPEVEIVFVSYGSTDSTHQWLDSLNDDNLKYYYSAEGKSLADTYNKCCELATGEYVVFAHNDMVLGPHFLENLATQTAEDVLLYYTTIEPPIFADDPRPWKIVKAFGEDVQSFDINSFNDFVNTLQTGTGQASEGVSFFLCVSRKVLTAMGGLDNLFNPMFCEDDDLILRLTMAGLKKKLVSAAACYHFVSKTSRFSADYMNKTQQIEINSKRNFIRKWGFDYSSPIKKKYDVGIVVMNANKDVLYRLEPWASSIYTDINPAEYIESEQPNTRILLREKIKDIKADKINDIIITLNGLKLNNKAFGNITRISELITHQLNKKSGFIARLLGNTKRFGKGPLTIQINQGNTHERSLINLNK